MPSSNTLQHTHNALDTVTSVPQGFTNNGLVDNSITVDKVSSIILEIGLKHMLLTMIVMTADYIITSSASLPCMQSDVTRNQLSDKACKRGFSILLWGPARQYYFDKLRNKDLSLLRLSSKDLGRFYTNERVRALLRE